MKWPACCARTGLLVASCFLFEKRFFPMMHDFQNTLYINIEDPTNATIFDRQWLQLSLRNLGLVVVRVVQPELRGSVAAAHLSAGSG